MGHRKPSWIVQILLIFEFLGRKRWEFICGGKKPEQ